MPPLLTLLTDFGLADYYVGAVKGTVLRLAPGTQLVDLSHDVPPGDVEGAADLLAAAAATFPAGTVHLAVVDPGVGSARRLLVVEAGGHRFVAPDNGLLTPQLEAGGKAWSVERRELFLDGHGATFHGRDRFAPIAAALVRGEEPESLGRAISDAVRLSLPAPRREREGERWIVTGRVARIDRYGNLVTDIPAGWVVAEKRAGTRAPHPAPTPEGSDTPFAARVLIGGHEIARWVTHYEEIPFGEPAALIGSLGKVELSLRGESLAARWNVSRGAAVVILT